jgi:hypothetical protein
MPTDLWYRRAVQAEYTLTQLRQIPNVPCVDILMGVPAVVVEEKRAKAREALKELRAKELADRRHRKPGDKGPIDENQRQLFFEEHERAKMETAFGGGLGIPQDMIGEVDFQIPEAIMNRGKDDG